MNENVYNLVASESPVFDVLSAYYSADEIKRAIGIVYADAEESECFPDGLTEAAKIDLSFDFLAMQMGDYAQEEICNMYKLPKNDRYDNMLDDLNDVI